MIKEKVVESLQKFVDRTAKRSDTEEFEHALNKKFGIDKWHHLRLDEDVDSADLEQKIKDLCKFLKIEVAILQDPSYYGMGGCGTGLIVVNFSNTHTRVEQVIRHVDMATQELMELREELNQ